MLTRNFTWQRPRCWILFFCIQIEVRLNNQNVLPKDAVSSSQLNLKAIILRKKCWMANWVPTESWHVPAPTHTKSAHGYVLSSGLRMVGLRTVGARARSESLALEKALLGHQFYSTVKQQPQFLALHFCIVRLAANTVEFAKFKTCEIWLCAFFFAQIVSQETKNTCRVEDKKYVPKPEMTHTLPNLHRSHARSGKEFGRCPRF